MNRGTLLPECKDQTCQAEFFCVHCSEVVPPRDYPYLCHEEHLSDMIKQMCGKVHIHWNFRAFQGALKEDGLR